MIERQRRGLLTFVGPGLLVAATGVGAGDLATAAFTGGQVGLAILWAVVLGSVMKFVLNEGLARWQLATGTTFLEGVVQRISPWVGWIFLPYLFLWSFVVGAALMGACGVAIHAMVPVFDDASQAKVVFGIVSSLVGLALIWKGGFPVFEKFMGASVAVMLVTVVVTAILLWPGTSVVVEGLVFPQIPDAGGEGLGWTVALIGGIGGTVTILCYGYWIREQGRTGVEAIRTSRLDLGLGYLVTGLFGIAMVIIGSTVNISTKGAKLIVSLADQLEEPLGPVGRWMFIIGAFGAIFSSLLGVWQAVPYLFADVLRLIRDPKTTNVDTAVDTKSNAYRGYLLAIAFIPMLGLLVNFKDMQKLYAIVGAAFMPLVAIGLLVLNGRRAWVGKQRNGVLTTLALLGTLAFFGYVSFEKWVR
jgi:Mn2+/Fe2+ NRAMP family transporter